MGTSPNSESTRFVEATYYPDRPELFSWFIGLVVECPVTRAQIEEQLELFRESEGLENRCLYKHSQVISVGVPTQLPQEQVEEYQRELYLKAGA